MCSKNRINHHTKHHTWTPGFLGGNPSREKTTAAVAQPSIFYYKENILQLMYWRRLIPARRHPPALVYQPLLEGSYDPLTRLPASPGRELRPPDLVYQPHLEGSYNPLTEGYNPQHLTKFSKPYFAYALSFHWCRVYTRFRSHKQAYTSVQIIEPILLRIRAFSSAKPRIYALPLRRTSV